MRVALDVERQFFVELALDTAASYERPNPQEQIGKRHYYASFMTRPMAVDMRSHSPASTAS